MSSGGASPSGNSPISSLLSQQTSTLPKPTQGMGSMMGGNFTPPPMQSQPMQGYSQPLQEQMRQMTQMTQQQQQLPWQQQQVGSILPLNSQIAPFLRSLQAQGRNGGKGGFPQGQRAELPFNNTPKTNGIASLLPDGDQQ